MQHAKQGIAPDYHDFLAEAGAKTEADVSRELKALEARRDELQGELTAAYDAEMDEKKADALRQEIEQLEAELSQHQPPGKATR